MADDDREREVPAVYRMVTGSDAIQKYNKDRWIYVCIGVCMCVYVPCYDGGSVIGY